MSIIGLSGPVAVRAEMEAIGMPGEQPPQWPLENWIELACLPSTAYWARKHTADLLTRWGLRACTDVAELLVSELVTNGLKASVDLDQPARSSALPCIRLRLQSDRQRLVVAVWDSNPEAPVMKDAGPDDESGRGLFLVGCLAKQWSYYFPPGGGKVVWCELPVEGGG
ncbi:ATP-binding protein [Actinomadura scrupuli]|uniref:ATP-binding protein n=1 Tax=Actinomadura scrupuli TaxID=559629 RepID=UPI003D981D80